MINIKWANNEGRAFVASVVEKGQQDERERLPARREQDTRGKRGQPPMTDQLRITTVYVEHLETKGVPFATARNSRMNKHVREWLNTRAARTLDTRKSRRRTISADAVEDLLKKKFSCTDSSSQRQIISPL